MRGDSDRSGRRSRREGRRGAGRVSLGAWWRGDDYPWWRDDPRPERPEPSESAAPRARPARRRGLGGGGGGGGWDDARAARGRVGPGRPASDQTALYVAVAAGVALLLVGAAVLFSGGSSSSSPKRKTTASRTSRKHTIRLPTLGRPSMSQPADRAAGVSGGFNAGSPTNTRAGGESSGESTGGNYDRGSSDSRDNSDSTGYEPDLPESGPIILDSGEVLQDPEPPSGGADDRSPGPSSGGAVDPAVAEWNALNQEMKAAGQRFAVAIFGSMMNVDERNLDSLRAATIQLINRLRQLVQEVARTTGRGLEISQRLPLTGEERDLLRQSLTIALRNMELMTANLGQVERAAAAARTPEDLRAIGERIQTESEAVGERMHAELADLVTHPAVQAIDQHMREIGIEEADVGSSILVAAGIKPADTEWQPDDSGSGGGGDGGGGGDDVIVIE